MDRRFLSIAITAAATALLLVLAFASLYVNRKEGFGEGSGSGVVDQIHRSHMQVYAPLIAPFFGQGTPQNAATATQTYFVWWEPAIPEVANIIVQPASTPTKTATIDDFSCVDRDILIPPSILAPSEAHLVDSASASRTCNVFIGDCAYAMRKVAIKVKWEIENQHLKLQRGDVAARTIILLRPCAIRIGADGPLFRVVWTATSVNGGDVSVSVSFDSETEGGLKLPIVPFGDSSLPPPHTAILVCYYLTYVEPRMGIPKTVPRQVASLMCCPVATSATSVSTRDAAGSVVLSCTVAQDATMATIRLNAQTVNVPTWKNSCLVVTWATDCLSIACFSSKRVTLTRMAVPRCSYSVADPDAIDAPAQGAPRSVAGRIRSTSIPNLADLATRLYPPESPSQQLSSMMSRMIPASPLAPAALGSVLRGGGMDRALRPGSVLTSPNGKWTLELLHDSRLVIRSRANPTHPREIGAAQPSIRDSIRPVACILDDSKGTISLIGEVAAAGGAGKIVYWTSSTDGETETMSTSPPPGTGSFPFELRMTDNGAAQVWGRFANKPIWSSSF